MRRIFCPLPAEVGDKLAEPFLFVNKKNLPAVMAAKATTLQGLCKEMMDGGMQTHAVDLGWGRFRLNKLQELDYADNFFYHRYAVVLDRSGHWVEAEFLLLRSCFAMHTHLPTAMQVSNESWRCSTRLSGSRPMRAQCTADRCAPLLTCRFFSASRIKNFESRTQNLDSQVEFGNDVSDIGPSRLMSRKKIADVLGERMDKADHGFDDVYLGQRELLKAGFKHTPLHLTPPMFYESTLKRAYTGTPDPYPVKEPLKPTLPRPEMPGPRTGFPTDWGKYHW